jgi:hypothetical protein
MSLAYSGPKGNIMARQNIYIRPKLNLVNEVYFSDSSDDFIIRSNSNSNTNTNSSSGSLFSSNDSLCSFEDYKIPIDVNVNVNVDVDVDKYKYNNVTLSECNRGIMTSICCGWCSRS